MEIEQHYIKNVEKLTPCPHIALDVLSIAHESDCSIPKLASKIEKDPNLTANMLQMGNSAYFGHMKKITSVTDIIVRLGLESVKIIAITSASVGLLKSSQKVYNLEPFSLWNHSYATAILSSIIGRHAKIEVNATLYTAALLHDIGKVILNQPLLEASYDLTEPVPDIKTVEFERKVLHTDHARVGRALLESWGLPKKLVVSVGMHHSLGDTADLPQNQKLLAHIVYLSNFLVNCIELNVTDQQKHFFNVLAFEDERNNLPQVPNFEENMESIIDAFFTKYTETVGVFVL